MLNALKLRKVNLIIESHPAFAFDVKLMNVHKDLDMGLGLTQISFDSNPKFRELEVK